MALPEPPTDPQLVLGPLRIWIAGRQLPDLDDAWDGNWLEIDARCATAAGEGRVAGALTHLSDLQDWVRELRRLVASGVGEAALTLTEPELSAGVTLGKTGAGVLTVEFLTWSAEADDWTTQSWTAPVEASAVADWITASERVLGIYPFRGKG